MAAFRALAERPSPFFRWAAGGPRDLSRWSYLATDPVETLSIAVGPRGLARDPWRALSSRWPRAVLRRGHAPPFSGGWAGALGYELRSAVERTPPPRAAPDGFPALFLARYEAVVAWDGAAGRAVVTGTGRTLDAARAAARALRDRVEAGLHRAPSPVPSTSAVVRARTSPAAYRRKVAAVIERIRDGDLFQANLSQKFEANFSGSESELFLRLAAASPSPFLTYMHLGDGRAILSASPECFLSLRGRRAETRPMKGTMPRGETPAKDAALCARLARSVKDRAELAMIVDLSRNDLGRVCEPGTVRVLEARRLERYATVHQTVGVVSGRLRADATGTDLVRAAFPPGSVTGAPKVEAMRAIDELEGEGRGPYCGAIGWFDDGGDLDLAVAIRTLALSNGRATYRVGGGITLLSDPEAERVETLDKGRALARAISGDAP